MKFLGMEVKVETALDKENVIIDAGKEKVAIAIDPAGKDEPYYILFRKDKRGNMVVFEHGELMKEKRRV